MTPSQTRELFRLASSVALDQIPVVSLVDILTQVAQTSGRYTNEDIAKALDTIARCLVRDAVTKPKGPTT